MQKVLCVDANTSLDLTPTSQRFKLGYCIRDSLGKTIIRLPIDAQGNYLEFETDVINRDTLILFGLDKMKHYGWYANEVTNGLICHGDPGLRIELKFKMEHLYLECPPSVVLFSRADSVKLDRRFERPLARKLAILLRKAVPD